MPVDLGAVRQKQLQEQARMAQIEELQKMQQNSISGVLSGATQDIINSSQMMDQLTKSFIQSINNNGLTAQELISDINILDGIIGTLTNVRYFCQGQLNGGMLQLVDMLGNSINEVRTRLTNSNELPNSEEEFNQMGKKEEN